MFVRVVHNYLSGDGSETAKGRDAAHRSTNGLKSQGALQSNRNDALSKSSIESLMRIINTLVDLEDNL